MSEAALAPAAPQRNLTWDDLQALVLDSVTSPHSKRAYARALEDFPGGQKGHVRELRSGKR